MVENAAVFVMNWQILQSFFSLAGLSRELFLDIIFTCTLYMFIVAGASLASVTELS